MKDKIKHIGNCFILGRQGRDIAKISESQLLECLRTLKTEMEKNGEVNWIDVIEYLIDQNTEKPNLVWPISLSNGGGP